MGYRTLSMMQQEIMSCPAGSSTQQMDSKLAQGVVKRCSCKRTKCLKLYCPCFADGLFCNAKCNCSDCFNDQNCIAQVQAARKAIQSKNPDAFKPKVRLSRATKAYGSTPHTQGAMGGGGGGDPSNEPAMLQH